MLNAYHPPAHLFFLYFPFLALYQLHRLSQLQQSPVPLLFPHPDVVVTTDATPKHWAFILRFLGYIYH